MVGDPTADPVTAGRHPARRFSTVDGLVLLLAVGAGLWLVTLVVSRYTAMGPLLLVDSRSATARGPAPAVVHDRAAAATAEPSAPVPEPTGDLSTGNDLSTSTTPERDATADTAPVASAAATAPIVANAIPPRPRDESPAPTGVAVFGDSLGDGIWGALSSSLPRSRFAVVRLSRISTGFTRFRQFDVAQHARQAMAAGRYGVAVICFGINDIQGVRDGGRAFGFMSSGWKNVLRQRIGDFLAPLEASGARIFWVMLPAMRDRGLDDGAVAYNAFLRETLQGHPVELIETRPLTLGADGGFAHYVRDPSGRLALLRANDGVHFSPRGYRVMVTTVIDQLDRTQRAASLPRPAGTLGEDRT